MKKCAKCLQNKEASKFTKNAVSPDGFNVWCRECVHSYVKDWYAQKKKEGKIVKYGLTRARSILYSAVHSDRRKGRDNDLDLNFVESIIASGCTYCHDVNAKMSIDRIDNSIGHIRSNVVPACSRCNWFRRDVPYEVWVLFVPIMREARLSGLLDNWHPGTGNGTKSKWKSKGDSEEIKRNDLAV